MPAAASGSVRVAAWPGCPTSDSPEALTSIGHDISWPVQLQRTAAAARGLYLSALEGTPLWRAPGKISLLDTGSPQMRALRIDLAEWPTTY